MKEEHFCFERNGYKTTQLKLLNCSYYIITGNGKRYIRKSLKVVNKIVSKGNLQGIPLRKNDGYLTR